MIRFVALLASLVLFACASPEGPDGPPRSVPPGPEATAGTVVLDGEGLRLVGPRTGSTRLVAFGTPEAEVVALVEGVLGALAEQSENLECGAGPVQFASWPDGFMLLAQDGAFGGWALNGIAAEPSSLSTMAGLGIGTTRAELDAAYDATVEESSLGAEFTAGDLYGVLSGFDADDRVENLWAGLSCNFR